MLIICKDYFPAGGAEMCTSLGRAVNSLERNSHMTSGTGTSLYFDMQLANRLDCFMIRI